MRALRPLIAATLVTGAAWGVMIPPFEGADESRYYRTVVSRVEGGPEPFHVTNNPGWRAASNRRGRVNMFMHGPAEGATRSELTRMYLLRALALCVGTAALMIVFETARLVGGRSDVALLTAGLCLCLPGLSGVLSKVHPGATAVLLGSTVYWTMAARALGRLGRVPAWIIGLAVVALAPFAGRQAHFLLLLVPLGLVVTETTGRAKLLTATAWLAVVFVAVRLPLFATLRSDLGMAIAPLRSAFGYSWWPSDLPEYLAFEFTPKLALSFFGWLGHQSLLLPAPVYAAMATAVGVALYGLGARRRAVALTREQRCIATIFCAGICLSFAPILYTNTLADRTAATGSWLHASIAPIMIALVAGWRSAVAVAQRSPRRVAATFAALAGLLAAIWLSGVGDIRGSIRANYVGDADHLMRTVSWSIVLLAMTAAAVASVAFSASRRWSWRSGSQQRTRLGLFAFAWVANLLLLMAFVAPLYAPLDAMGLAVAVREEAADGEYTRAANLYRLAAAVYPESMTLSRVVFEVPLPLKGGSDPLFTSLRSRLARAEPLDNRADLMALARVAHTKHVLDPEILRAVAQRIASAPGLREPLALIRGEVEGRLDDGSAADVVRAAGGIATPQNMHDEAILEGYTISRGVSDRNEVTVYFRPLRSWSGRQLWVHAYPDGSHDYLLLSPSPPAFDSWRSGALAWETFPLPSNARYVLYVGVEVAQNLGPAYPIGAVGR